MAKRIPESKARPTRPRDVNQLAHQLIQEQTGQDITTNPEKRKIPAAISRYMADLGRRGGKLGGTKRAARMTEAERSNAAAMAARARWAKAKAKAKTPVQTPAH